MANQRTEIIKQLKTFPEYARPSNGYFKIFTTQQLADCLESCKVIFKREEA